VKRRAALALLSAAGATACGYALVGKGVTIDPSIRRIGVPVFRDGTGKPGMDQKVTQKVIEELLKRGRFDVVQEAAGVDALVEGDLISYIAVPIGFSDEGGARTQANRYSVTLTARVRYTKTGQQEPIWQNDAFATRDEYDVAGDPSEFVQLEEQAQERLTTQFARSLVAAMLEAF